MHKRYCHNSLNNNRSGNTCCKPSQSINTESGGPESMRILGANCNKATVSIESGSCLYSQPMANENVRTKVSLPVIPGYPVPVIEVRSTPASKTTKQREYDIQFNAQNQYNPDTRFIQYFPPAPIPYQCPERIPNNEPLPRQRPCLPVQQFQGSVKKPLSG